ncbi:Flocculation protein FLO11-like [Caenorhabditis elegans]|uniref:Flocculation protein FLO11-like n=1 Tax=Caenorhabditis elegans TaxID=6239 RepID=U4PMW9_CAEEL|nr:Flocculation protein FLO11-like [Caenorhabditis elegans]CDH93435.1 Flocculation protein FLO11-like [Caenorhabditis elegans]|eukprot:NP_001294628.1 Uncharacterized protein CELE_R08C7.12 [Caenorhabditis elegans]
MFLCNATTVAPPLTCWDPYWDSKCADMSRSIDSSSSRMLPSPITNFVTPSSSFSSHQMHDIYSLAASYLQAPPPPYTPTTAFHPHNAHQLLLLHNMTAAVQTPEDPDIDVVGLADTTNLVSLNDKEDEEKLDQTTESEESDRISISTTEECPLDLTFKPTSLDSPTSSTFIPLRPSVIIDHHIPKPHTSVRRSMSSVSSSASSTQEEVAAHFRRSLSGKWPKRCKVNSEEARNSPLRRRPSFNTHTSVSSLSVHSVSPTPPVTSSAQTIIVNNHCSDTTLSVADHFRRALLGKGLFDFQRKSNK